MDRFVKLSESLAIEGEFVNHQEMADLISKHKETKMENPVFKISDVLKVAEVSAGGNGKVIGVRPAGDRWIMDYADGKFITIAADCIEWLFGVWMIESNFKNVSLGTAITSGGKEISTPTELVKLLKSETNNFEEVLHGGIPVGQMAAINVKPGVYVPPQTATESDQGEEQRSPIWYENQVTWARGAGRKMNVPYCVRLSDLVSASPLRCYINGYPLADVIAYSDSKELVRAINANGDEYVLVNTLTFSCENLVIDHVDYNNTPINITITEERPATAALSPTLRHLQVSAVDMVLSAFEPSGEHFCLSKQQRGPVDRVVKVEYITHDDSRVLLVVRDDEHGIVSALCVVIAGFTKDDFVVTDLDINAKYFVKPFRL